MVVLIEFLAAFLAGSMAVTVALQSRRSAAHWLFAAGMLALAIETLLVGLSADPSTVDQLVFWQNWKELAGTFVPGFWLAFSLVYARGSAREILTRWRAPLTALSVGLPVYWFVFRDRWLHVASPDHVTRDGLLRITVPAAILNLIVLLTTILVLLNLERTFRASVGTMRWRIKFMILGLGVLFTVRAYTSVQVLLYRSAILSLQALNSVALVIACLLILRTLLRSGHFEVSVYPSQLVLHHSVTLLLAGIYLLVVGALVKLVSLFPNNLGWLSAAFLVLVSLLGLTILLLSDRVRLHTRRWISRHFQRPTYDYRSVWRGFTEGTARHVERGTWCSAVVKLVSEIFQSLSVTIWLVDERGDGLGFGASTALLASQADCLRLGPGEVGGIVGALRDLEEPIDIDASDKPWAASVGRLYPTEFVEGGHRICVPLRAGGEVLGLMTLADRVASVPFSAQDLDLLKAVAGQAAAGLLNIRLSSRLSQAKQLEAFQAMSAFFVHDLKNTASTLSLMLRNLPLHYQDPKFREDALRGISKTVSHINDLINRLGMLRQELTVQTVDCDLNDVVKAGLKAYVATPGIELVVDLNPLPEVRADPAQIQKVLTNLVLNAREAIGTGGGQILVQTNQRTGWAVLGVTDNGCGMAPEFVQRSLFRPFQTTKKQGIGIGMFHCKMIVEAHHGWIEVESQPGRGTVFRVLLPLSAGRRTGEAKN